VQFASNISWNKRIKQVPGAKRSKTLNGWTITDTKENRLKCKLESSESNLLISPVITQTPKNALGFLSQNNREQMQIFLNYLELKAYGASTIRTYRNEFAQLLQQLGYKPVQELQPLHLQRYLLF
jgi:integrase/recombinase XerD